MKQCKSGPGLIIITVILTAFVVSMGINLWKNQETNLETPTQEPILETPQQTPLEHQDWIEYKSDKGFSFKHPKGYGVNEKDDILHIVKLDETGEFAEVPPSLQINVSPNSVSFALWEGISWEGYPDIIGTFEMK